MKLSRSFIHVLLSLILLLSQQIGIAHVTEHLTVNKSSISVGSGNSPSDTTNQADVPDALEADCEQCLALEHISIALTNELPTLPPMTHASFIAAASPEICLSLHTAHCYRSRAPPTTL